MAQHRQKKGQSTRHTREEMLRYLNRFKLKKKQIKYKPRTYANLQGINSLRSQNAVNIEPQKPVIKERVKARLNCNLNALLQLDNEINSNNRRTKPQESYINMELNVARKNPNRKSQQNEVELEAVQDRLSENFRSEFSLDPLYSDYRSDFETCFEIQNDCSTNGQKNHRQNNYMESSLSKRLGKQQNDFHDISPSFTHREASVAAKQSSNRKKTSQSRNGHEIEFTDHSFYEHDQSERVKQKEFHRLDDAFNVNQKCSRNEWDTSMPSKSLNQPSEIRRVFPDPTTKFPSIIRSDGRFGRNHNRKVTKNTRASSMLDKVFHEKSSDKTPLLFENIAPKTKQRTDKKLDSSFQTTPFERNKINAFVNPPSTIYSSVGSEYIESWNTIRNGVRAGHGNEPPTLPGIPDKVFFDRTISYERFASYSFSGSNVLSAFGSIVQSISECSRESRPSKLSATFTRTYYYLSK